MARTAYIVESDCVGCELCTRICIAFLINQATGKAQFIENTPAKETEIQEAIENCPVQCIHWKE